jgi:hypothetical protein
MGEILCIRVMKFAAKLVEVLIPVALLVHNVNIFVLPSNMFCLFTEIYCNLDEVILEQ